MSAAHTIASVRAVPIPRRGHVLAAAVAFTLLALYGSFVPLNYRPLPWDDAVTRFRNIPFRDLGIKSRADWVANILLFIPLGCFWCGVILVDRQKSWLRLLSTPIVAVLVVAALAGLAVGIEFTQIWFPPRTVSQNDIQAESIGGAVGVGLWLMLGQRVVNWCRTWTAQWRTRSPLDFLLLVYLAGLAIYSVMPLDLTIQPSELYQKLAKGRLELIPFSEGSVWSAGFWWLRVTDVLVFVPVGWWAARVGTRPGAGPRSVGGATFVGALVVVGIELVQIFIYSRFTSTTEILFGTAGTAVGAWLVQRFTARSAVRPAAASSSGLTRLAWALAILAYSAMLCVLYWWPMELLRDRQEAERRLAHFFSIPFASLYRGSEFNALTEITRKSLLYGGLAVLWVGFLRSLPLSRQARRGGYVVAWLYAAALACGIEAVQAVFPPHVTDITDVLIESTATAAGLFIATQLFFVRRSPSTAGDLPPEPASRRRFHVPNSRLN
jgi:glycopeptide antibiotics resistance protein